MRIFPVLAQNENKKDAHSHTQPTRLGIPTARILQYLRAGHTINISITKPGIEFKIDIELDNYALTLFAYAFLIRN